MNLHTLQSREPEHYCVSRNARAGDAYLCVCGWMGDGYDVGHHMFNQESAYFCAVEGCAGLAPERGRCWKHEE